MLGAACCMSLTGCIEDTELQSSTVTDEMVAESPAATANMAAGMPAATIDVWDTSSHCFFGLPAEMIFRDMLTGDYLHSGETGYSHFISWQRNQYMGDGYLKTQFHWNFYYGFLLGVNQLIGAIDPEIATDEQKAFLGEGLAFRAMAYLDMARMYEFLPNDIFPDGKNDQGKVVTNLTVPIVTDKTTPEEATNNPRATREEMAKFIEEDLTNAESYITYQTTTDGGTQPTLACVYGLKARLYMWIEDYAKAAEYADKAITTYGKAPLSASVALDANNGFNTADQFMWAMQQTSSNDCVSTGIINWSSWTTNQTTFGYTGSSTTLFTKIDKKMYERISDTDWRKQMWVAPAGSALEGKFEFPASLDEESKQIIGSEAYVALKFRPGNGDCEDYNVGAATAVPIMRVEEMYFIKAEALAHTGGDALGALKAIMTTRDPQYSFNSTDKIALVDEIIFQKRVELWGEGQTFFDLKRLNMSVTRGYTGTNWTDTKALINTNGRPAWLNIVMVRTESNNNHALEGMNNPDPSDKYTPWTE